MLAGQRYGSAMGTRRRATGMAAVSAVMLATTMAGCGMSGGGAKLTVVLTAPHVTSVVFPPPPPARPRSSRVRHRVVPLRLPTVLPDRVLTVPVLLYHRIGHAPAGADPVSDSLTVSLGDFDRQMAWLASHGYHGIGQRQLFQALFRGRALPRKPVVISFDDGYAGVVAAARDLHRLGWPGTAYLITDRISALPGFLTWREVGELERLGMDIGSHTVHHRDLTALPPSVLRAELWRSRRVLERHVGHPVQWFAYPFGRLDDRVVTAVRAAGYVLAATTDHGVVQSALDPLRLRRIRVVASVGWSLAALLGPGG